VLSVAYCPALLGVDISPRVWQVTILAMFSNLKKKYLQCILAARILTVDFVMCTLAVEKKNQGRFRPVGSDNSLVRSKYSQDPVLENPASLFPAETKFHNHTQPQTKL
jgi:hypothetical protein